MSSASPGTSGDFKKPRITAEDLALSLPEEVKVRLGKFAGASVEAAELTFQLWPEERLEPLFEHGIVHSELRDINGQSAEFVYVTDFGRHVLQHFGLHTSFDQQN